MEPLLYIHPEASLGEAGFVPAPELQTKEDFVLTVTTSRVFWGLGVLIIRFRLETHFFTQSDNVWFCLLEIEASEDAINFYVLGHISKFVSLLWIFSTCFVSQRAARTFWYTRNAVCFFQFSNCVGNIRCQA